MGLKLNIKDQMEEDDFPQKWDTYFSCFSEDIIHDIERNAEQIATFQKVNKLHQYPFIVEYYVTPGEIEGIFTVKRPSALMARAIIFKDEQQKEEYLKSKQLKFDRS